MDKKSNSVISTYMSVTTKFFAQNACHCMAPSLQRSIRTENKLNFFAREGGEDCGYISLHTVTVCIYKYIFAVILINRYN